VICTSSNGAPRKPLRVLHVEDSEDDSAIVMRVLHGAGLDPSCERVATQRAFKDALRAKEWDVIISEYALPRYSGLTALADTREVGKDPLAVIIVNPRLEKPFEVTKILHLIANVPRR
jgi:DNA-binding response OmpR family regulator